jgi:hypothetical protein
MAAKHRTRPIQKIGEWWMGRFAFKATTFRVSIQAGARAAGAVRTVRYERFDAYQRA